MDVEEVGRLQRSGGNIFEVCLKEEAQSSQTESSYEERDLPPGPIELKRQFKGEELQKLRKQIKDLKASRDIELNEYERFLGVKKSGTLTKEVDEFFNMALKSARQPDNRDTAWQRVVELEDSRFRFKTIRMLVYKCALDYVNGDTERFVALKEDLSEKSLGDLGKQLARSQVKIKAIDTDMALLNTLCEEINEEIMELRGRELEERKQSIKKALEEKIRMIKEREKKDLQGRVGILFRNEAEGEPKGWAILDAEERIKEREEKERLRKEIEFQERRKRPQRKSQVRLGEELKEKEKSLIHDERLQPIIVTGETLGETLLLPPPVKDENEMEKLKEAFKQQDREGKRKDREERVDKMKRRRFPIQIVEKVSDEMYNASDFQDSESGTGEPAMHQALKETQVLSVAQSQPPQIQPKAQDLFSWDSHTGKQSSTARIASQFSESWGRSFSQIERANLSAATAEHTKHIRLGTSSLTSTPPMFNRAYRPSKATNAMSRMKNDSRTLLPGQKLQHLTSSNDVSKNHPGFSRRSGCVNNGIEATSDIPKVNLPTKDPRITHTKDPRSRPTDPRLR
jgi:hypothetical protein